MLGERLDQGSEVGWRVLGWRGDPGGWADGLPLRLCGGLHALVRSGLAPELAELYPPRPVPTDAALWSALEHAFAAEEAFILPWLNSPPQTNEVGRAGALMSGLLVVAAEFGLPLLLFELGASAGLNLILDRYGYRLGGVSAGDAGSPLQLAPQWQGPPPPGAAVRVAGRQGVDLHPLDVTCDGERLLAYVWPDQQERLHRLEKALAIAVADPPRIDTGEVADWVEAQFEAAPAPGLARVVMHSVAFQYFPEASQRRISDRIEQAGALAGADAPVAWLRFEKEPGDRETSLRLRLWPGGGDRLLASCQPHGATIHWLVTPPAG